MRGHLVIAAGALIGTAAAGGITAALFSGAEVAPWVGPVGWAAALIMAAGAIIVATSKKNDLQMFAMHCFLGTNYGVGEFGSDTGKPWMLERSWREMRYSDESESESRERFLIQRAALLRLICGYSTMIIPDHRRGGLHLFPGMLPPGASFEVEVQFWTARSQREKYRVKIIPDQQKFTWLGQAPGEGSSVTMELSTAACGQRRIIVNVKPKLDAAFSIRFHSRLMLDPDGELKIPAAAAKLDTFDLAEMEHFDFDGNDLLLDLQGVLQSTLPGPESSTRTVLHPR